jgi:cytoskeletal protein CcmA (bactofilin family)
MARTNELEGAMNTIIGKGSKLEGKMTVAQSIRIDGSFKGEINATDTLIVGTTGELTDVSVNVKNAIIGGKIKGNVTASSKVTLESSSRLEGDLTAKLLVIEEGSLFTGNCKSGEQAISQAAVNASAPEAEKKPMSEKPRF